MNRLQLAATVLITAALAMACGGTDGQTGPVTTVPATSPAPSEATTTVPSTTVAPSTTTTGPPASTPTAAPRSDDEQILDVIERYWWTIAGIGINVDDVRAFDRAAWDPMVAVNLTAAFEMSHAVASTFIEQGSGKIINVCSMFSFLGGQRSPAYAATKHGIAGLTKAYADELGPFGCQVNGIAPGYFATELTAETRANPEYDRAVLDHIPAGEWGQVQDLMGACVFLASRASDYVNGHVLAVDGGYLVR